MKISWRRTRIGITSGRLWQSVKLGNSSIACLNLISIWSRCARRMVLGPMLQPELNQSSLKVYDYVMGNTAEIPRAIKTVVDIRDVALAHIVAFENPQASGRYLLVGASPTEE
ncbi:hypothetical protein LEN26_019859 [Aphanomyces euteiches]|nr:hypothetical protein LEN26_019859 [Aphanomyces euteiches]